MDALFETKATLTFEEIMKLQKFRLRRMKYFRIPCGILSVLMVLYSLYFGMYLYALIFLAMAWYWIFGDNVLSKRNANRMYKSNKSLQNLEITYYFYEDYMVQESEIGRVEFKYADFYKIEESKTNFYLRDTRRSAVIIVKENCTEELCEFIRKLKVK